MVTVTVSENDSARDRDPAGRHGHGDRIMLSFKFDLDFIVISRVDSNRARPGGIIMITIMMIMIVTVMVQQGVGCYRGVGFLC